MLMFCPPHSCVEFVLGWFCDKDNHHLSIVTKPPGLSALVLGDMAEKCITI